MSGKLKALGLALLVAMAVAATGAVSASAEVTGHIAVEIDDATLVGSENEVHNSQFSVDGGTPIECGSDSYEGEAGAETLAGFTLKPEYPKCKTAGSETYNIAITVNGCDYTLKSTSGTHATFWIQCPSKQAIEIHHPNCTIKFLPKSNLTGIRYTTLTEAGKHALTVDLTVENIEVEYHGGICIFLGTNHKGALKGSFTIRATDAGGNAVGITNT